MYDYRQLLITVGLLMFTSGCSLVQAKDEQTCLESALISAADTETIGDIRQKCQKEAVQSNTSAVKKKASTYSLDVKIDQTLVESRIEAEKEIEHNPFILSTHNPSFILPITYMKDPNQAPFDAIGDGVQLDNEEVVFQISFKIPIIYDVLDTDSDVFFGYTSRSWWQLYNQDFSAAFRETNYQPEFFLRHYGGPSFSGVKVAGWDVGLVHESNGRSEVLSRSWNRAFISTLLDADSLSLLLKLWYRIPESEEEDENPDIYRYLGYGEIRAIYAPNENTFTAMLRPGTEEYGVELTWSRPMSNNLRFYVLYYDGYGESLLDYDQPIQRLGMGIVLNDFLHR